MRLFSTRFNTVIYFHREDSIHGNRNQIDYIICTQRWRSSIQLARIRLGADCGSDRELIAKFRHTLKKVGKTTRRFKNDLNSL